MIVKNVDHHLAILIGDNCKQGILHVDWVQAISTILDVCLAPYTDGAAHPTHPAHPIGRDTRRDRANPTLSLRKLGRSVHVCIFSISYNSTCCEFPSRRVA